MYWYEFSQNPKMIEGYYEPPPTLDDIELCLISLGSVDGLVIQAVLPYPEKKPKSWEGKGFNAALLQLSLCPIISLKIMNWTSWRINNNCSFNFSKLDSGNIHLLVNGEKNCNIEIEFTHLLIQRLEGYTKALEKKFFYTEK